MGRGYSFETIRARMLYDEKARKDGTVIEEVRVDDDEPAGFEFVTTTRLNQPRRKKKVRRAVEYGPYIPTLCRLLEEGHFE